MNNEQQYYVLIGNVIAFIGTEADCWEFIEELPIHLQNEYTVYPDYSKE